MALVDLRRVPSVPLDFMNGDHHQEANLLNDLADSVTALRAGVEAPVTVRERFASLYAHTREHFAREEAAMERARFPAFPTHKAEHDRVLAEMTEEGRHFSESCDVHRLWDYVSRAVPSWFVQHIETMDLVTARFVTTAAVQP
jgi:hemerythrin